MHHDDTGSLIGLREKVDLLTNYVPMKNQQAFRLSGGLLFFQKLFGLNSSIRFTCNHSRYLLIEGSSKGSATIRVQ